MPSFFKDRKIASFRVRSLSSGAWWRALLLRSVTVVDREKTFSSFSSDVSSKLHAPACLLNTLILQVKKRKGQTTAGRGTNMSLGYLSPVQGFRVRFQWQGGIWDSGGMWMWRMCGIFGGDDGTVCLVYAWYICIWICIYMVLGMCMLHACEYTCLYPLLYIESKIFGVILFHSTLLSWDKTSHGTRSSWI